MGMYTIAFVVQKGTCSRPLSKYTRYTSYSTYKWNYLYDYYKDEAQLSLQPDNPFSAETCVAHIVSPERWLELTDKFRADTEREYPRDMGGAPMYIDDLTKWLRSPFSVCEYPVEIVLVEET